jgi:hypothetical protein
MTDFVFYKKPVLLNRDLHRQRCVGPGLGFEFASRANCLYLAGVEFNEAAKEYPIVFTRSGGSKVIPVAMLGLRAVENLFVQNNEHGVAMWQAKYIPAFVRRYPFVLAQMPDSDMGVCIDEACPSVKDSVNHTNNDESSHALFDANGKSTPFLQNAVDFLTKFQQEFQRTEAFCERLSATQLLTDINARADLTDGRSFSINGLLVVDEKKLLSLPDAQVLALFRAGDLHWLSLHLASLSNMQGLVDRLAARKALMPQAPLPIK